jgi:hypothetical protein
MSSTIPGKTDTTIKTGAPAGDRLLEAIFGDRVGDGLSDAERAMNARRAVWAAEDAAKAAAQAAADAARAAAQAAVEAAKADAAVTAATVADRVRKAAAVLVAEGSVEWSRTETIVAFRTGYRGSDTLVKACGILAAELDACDDRVEDIVAECYGLI